MFPSVDSSAVLTRPKKRIRSSANLHPVLAKSQGTFYNPNPLVLLPDEYQLQIYNPHSFSSQMVNSRKRSRSNFIVPNLAYEDHSQFDFMHPSFPALSLPPSSIPLPASEAFIPLSDSVPQASNSIAIGTTLLDEDQATTSSVTSSTVSREPTPTPDDFAAIAAIVDQTSSSATSAMSRIAAIVPADSVTVDTIANTGIHKCIHPGCEDLIPFYTRSDLQSHNRTVHKGKKRHMCKYCPKSFGHSGHLNRHTESVHLQRRRHKCGLCGDAFFQASHLQSHINHVHKRRKPWECTECNLKLTTENALRNHLKNVHGATPKHCCALCDNKFILNNDLNRHMRRCHPSPNQV